jgi:hypothetical protein
MDRGQIKNRQSLIGGREEESWRSRRVPWGAGVEGNEHGGPDHRRQGSAARVRGCGRVHSVQVNETWRLQ